jgi:hypothetical protein
MVTAAWLVWAAVVTLPPAIGLESTPELCDQKAVVPWMANVSGDVTVETNASEVVPASGARRTEPVLAPRSEK